MNNPNTVIVDQTNFDAVVLKADKPVLVDFWAEWCGPCRTLGPVIDALADQFAGQATIAKIDVDASPALAQRYGVRSIPTVILFRHGAPAQTFVGIRPRTDYAAALSGALRAA